MKRKSLLLSLCLIFTLVLSACSSNFVATDTDREISAVATSPLSLDELMTIKSTPRTKAGANFPKTLQGEVPMPGVQIVFIPDEKMSNDEAFKIAPVIEDQAYKIKIYHSASALTDKGAAQELKLFLNSFPETFKSNYAIFEVYYNSKASDFTSMQVLAKMRAKVYEVSGYLNLDEAFYTESTQIREAWKETLEKYEAQERIHNKSVRPLFESRKAVMDALDRANDDEQFRNLVAKNDRKGATELLRKYLPWEEMPPFEKMFWENHLKIMADPLPYEDRVLIYRGINDDIVQVAQVGGVELSREEAIKEQKMFLMSTMMTKNQGTWNRRLRSLTAMYEKFMGTDDAGSSEYTRAARITNMFYKHSRQPKGSPFLSYTPKFDIARSFGAQRNTAYFLDPRMIYFNYTSGYTNEIEFLLPIMSFPDDLAGLWDSTIHAGQNNDVAYFKKMAIEKLEQVSKGNGEKLYDRIKLNSDKYFKPVLTNVKNGAVKAPEVKPDGKIMSFFKNLLGIPTKKAAVIIDEKSDMACIDLLQLFWK